MVERLVHSRPMSGLARTCDHLSCCTTRKMAKKRTPCLAGVAGAFAPANRIGRSGTRFAQTARPEIPDPLAFHSASQKGIEKQTKWNITARLSPSPPEGEGWGEGRTATLSQLPSEPPNAGSSSRGSPGRLSERNAVKRVSGPAGSADRSEGSPQGR